MQCLSNTDKAKPFNVGYFPYSQQPGVQAPPVRPRRNDRNNGAGGPQGRGGGSSGGSDDSNRGRRYRPY